MIHGVVIPSTHLRADHVTVRDQVRKDQLRGTFGDLHRCRDVAQPEVRIVRHAEQHVRMVGQEGPPARRTGPVIPRFVCHTLIIGNLIHEPNRAYCVEAEQVGDDGEHA